MHVIPFYVNLSSILLQQQIQSFMYSMNEYNEILICVPKEEISTLT